MLFTSNEKLRWPIGRLFSRWYTYGDAFLHKDFANWLWQRVWRDEIPGRAAQLSYYFLLSFFPLLICLSALLGYFFAADTGLEHRLLEELRLIMPGAAFDAVKTTTDKLLETRGGGKLSFGLLVALWLASSGMEAVIEGLNVAFQVEEARPWWKRRLVALGLTVSFALLAGGALALALAGSAGGRLVMDLVGLAGIWSPLWRAMRWVGSAAFLLVAINLVYHFGPNLKTRRKTHVILPGAIVAVICWIAASAALRLYLDHFSTFSSTYGPLGATIALLLWLYWTGAALLLGGEVNSGIQVRLRRSVG